MPLFAWGSPTKILILDPKFVGLTNLHNIILSFSKLLNTFYLSLADEKFWWTSDIQSIFGYIRWSVLRSEYDWSSRNLPITSFPWYPNRKSPQKGGNVGVDFSTSISDWILDGSSVMLVWSLGPDRVAQMNPSGCPPVEGKIDVLEESTTEGNWPS